MTNFISSLAMILVLGIIVGFLIYALIEQFKAYPKINKEFHAEMGKYKYTVKLEESYGMYKVSLLDEKGLVPNMEYYLTNYEQAKLRYKKMVRDLNSCAPGIMAVLKNRDA